MPEKIVLGACEFGGVELGEDVEVGEDESEEAEVEVELCL